MLASALASCPCARQHRGAIGRSLDLVEHLAGLDDRAFDEVAPADDAADLRAHVGRIRGPRPGPAARWSASPARSAARRSRPCGGGIGGGPCFLPQAAKGQDVARQTATSRRPSPGRLVEQAARRQSSPTAASGAAGGRAFLSGHWTGSSRTSNPPTPFARGAAEACYSARDQDRHRHLCQQVRVALPKQDFLQVGGVAGAARPADPTPLALARPE